MKLGQITSYIDVAQVTLYLFWIFFAGLIFYLRREDRREGYPLVLRAFEYLQGRRLPVHSRRPKSSCCLTAARPRPTGKADTRAIKAEKIDVWPGAPLQPTGDPMLAAVGPGSYAERADMPDLDHRRPRQDRTAARCDELCVATAATVIRAAISVIGADRRRGGHGHRRLGRPLGNDHPLSRSRASGGSDRTALIPMTFARIDKRRGQVKVHALLADHFANVPALANPDQVTLLEEDKICAYFGAGTLYAHPSRAEPLL